jgi:putative peptidoglycan lipid II flippase
VLAATGPPIVLLASLGAALLVATAVPVARIFVLGPGSGRTGALSWPIMAFAPAVIGFALLGLASRTLLAQHLARAAGLTTVVGWGVVILCVLVLRSLVPPGWVVSALAGAVSIGMVAGAGLGWALISRSQLGQRTDARPRSTGPDGGRNLRPSGGKPTGLGLRRSLLVTVPAAVVAGPGAAWLSRGLGDADILGAILGAFGSALGCAAAFLVLVTLIDRRQIAQLIALRTGQEVRNRADSAGGRG